jgi:hypothetical protein
MKFQITGQGWPLDGGAWLAPAGTIIDATSNDHWSLKARGLTPPINSTPLDDEAWQAQQAASGEAKAAAVRPRLKRRASKRANVSSH